MTDMGILTSKDLWNPNTYYYAKDRYKHMIEHEGSLLFVLNRILVVVHLIIQNLLHYQVAVGVAAVN